uniref:Ovule protein n=1 Tax=Brugia timori TaxID=42155 RepID=A0A0R3R964_9BILA
LLDGISLICYCQHISTIRFLPLWYQNCTRYSS